MPQLHASVGCNGKNDRADVLIVQKLLKERGQSPGAVDGICGQKTIAAIRSFSRPS
jgi:peptidoglycan hydrolase-like protein with peptidoglycan-binding domain